ncbi:MAG: histidine kinase dimerization/phospho-acceptor domain-containing protein [Vicinamibacterales bacterium]
MPAIPTSRSSSPGSHPNEHPALTYYSRTDRMPTWMPSPGEEVLFPVAPGRSEATDRLLMPAIARSAVEGRQFATFDTVIDGVPYQVVAFLRYADTSREDMSSIVGFAVNLDWVRAHYFHDIVGQILRMQGAEPELALRIADADGHTIVATGPFDEGPSSRRRFPLLFFNPSLVALDPPKDLAHVLWVAEADTSADRALSAARDGARRTMSVAAASAVVLAIGFVFTFQAVRTNARLTTMKSEFVSAVTHELKTPIATIRAASETLASGRPLDPERSRQYRTAGRA